MAVTASVLDRFVTGDRLTVVGLLTFSGTYTTGGETITLSQLGARPGQGVKYLSPDAAADATTAYVARWNGSKTAPKVQLFRQTAATGALVEVPNATSIAGITARTSAVIGGTQG